MTAAKLQLNDGNLIPQVGFGTFRIPADGSTYEAVLAALKAGYRHIDTAVAYFNEQEVGRAVKDSGIDRSEIFVTSKLWLQDYAYEDAKRALDLSLEKLGLDYIDLYLLHQPYGKVDEAWRVLQEAKQAGKVRSIGVSNVTPKLWAKWAQAFEQAVPAVNQVEFNLYYQQRKLRDVMQKYGVTLEAWAPLGAGNKEMLTEPLVQQLATKYNKNAGQIILRFITQEGVVVLPKSTHPTRIKTNQDVFDFTLTSAEMDALRALDKGKGQHDPDAPGVDKALAAFDVHAND